MDPCTPSPVSRFFRVGNKQKVLEINSPGFHPRNITNIHRYALNELILKSFVLESMTGDLENGSRATSLYRSTIQKKWSCMTRKTLS